MSETAQRPSVLYNGACPVCRYEIEHYRRLDAEGARALAFEDISKPGAETCGVGPEAMRRRLHLREPDGRMLIGVEAFARIWALLPRYRWLARLVRLPGMGRLASWLYEPIAASLYAWDKRRRGGTPARS